MYRLALLSVTAALAACGPDPLEPNASLASPSASDLSAAKVGLPPPSFNPETHLNSQCRASPPVGVLLTPLERCQVEALSARCNVADDCLVTCITSTEAREIGGGCWHICFGTVHSLDFWEAPQELEKCEALLGRQPGG